VGREIRQVEGPAAETIDRISGPEPWNIRRRSDVGYRGVLRPIGSRPVDTFHHLAILLNIS